MEATFLSTPESVVHTSFQLMFAVDSFSPDHSSDRRQYTPVILFSHSSILFVRVFGKPIPSSAEDQILLSCKPPVIFFPCIEWREE